MGICKEEIRDSSRMKGQHELPHAHFAEGSTPKVLLGLEIEEIPKSTSQEEEGPR